MNVLQNTRNELNLCLKENRPDRSYRDTLLTETESRYAQIEKEMLAIVFSAEKFNDFTFGRRTVVHTDRKPVESIFMKPLQGAIIL